MTAILLIAVVLVGAAVAWFVTCSRQGELQKPSYFRDPIPPGYFRVVGVDEVGGAELYHVVGDFLSFEEAQEAARQARQEAEERAGKVGVKLVFPIFFFILPSMLVVAAGPGLLQIFKYLFPMMKQIQ